MKIANRRLLFLSFYFEAGWYIIKLYAAEKNRTFTACKGLKRGGFEKSAGTGGKEKESVMGLFNRMKEPVFLKESSDAQRQLEVLKELEPQLDDEGKALIRQDMKCLEYGIAGEQNIAYELKNSHMPMYILHDIYLEDGELSAQIDYLVFTKKICFVIECKNLFGNIEIDSSGNFVRTMEFYRTKKKEGIYSPITQNQRHLELMKKMIVDGKNNILTKFMAGKYFEDFNKSVVVLANPKTVLNAKYAKKDTKEKVIRADQLVKFLKDTYNQSKEQPRSEDAMLDWATTYLNLHKNVQKDYTKKYERYRIKNDIEAETKTVLTEAETIVPKTPIPSEKAVEQKAIPEQPENSAGKEDVPIEETPLFKELRSYRWNKSKEEQIKPYFIYNDSQLKDLISKMPRTKETLKTVNGFGEVKVNKYGDDILRIVAKY